MSTVETLPQLCLNNILVATDFSEISKWALEFAVELGRRNASKVTVVHAIEPEPFAGVPLDPLHESSLVARNEAQEKLNRFADSRAFVGLQHRTIVSFGSVWNVIKTVAEDDRVDLIVVATHGRSGIKHLMLGSVAEQIFRNSDWPVLTIGPHARPGYGGEVKNVLFATDFTKSAERAFAYAVALARENDATLNALYVTNFYFGEGGDLSSEMLLGAEKLLREKLPKPEGVARFNYLARQGWAADGILTAAEEEGADLIVMGLHRHSAVSTHLPWSTVHQVVAHARCPVLTVR